MRAYFLPPEITTISVMTITSSGNSNNHQMSATNGKNMIFMMYTQCLTRISFIG